MRAEHRQHRRHAACRSNPRAAGGVVGVPTLLKPARCARGPRGQARPGIEPARAWQPLRGELLAQFNITGCCAHARRSLASSLGAGHARNPRYVLRPSAPARGIGSEYRAHAPPIPMLVRTRSTGCASHGVRRAARAVIELAPARPPSAPRGGSRALSTVLPSVAPCSPRQGQALRAREYARP
jgi:hypothetical protein